MLPEKGVGVPFVSGDVLQVHDKSDKLYWQAENIRTKEHGLIPSEWLEDRRRTKKIQKEAKKRQVSTETQTKLFSASHSQVNFWLTNPKGFFSECLGKLRERRGYFKPVNKNFVNNKIFVDFFSIYFNFVKMIYF